MMTGFIKFGFLAVLLMPPTLAKAYQDTPQAMSEVILIARAISALKPRLDTHKYLEYALGIYRASKKYNIQPALLVAITQQETSFRERLPMGRAGEIGITQILKSWLRNPKFRKEFKHASRKSMQKPANGFLYSAWILKELKKNRRPGTLPYWSYYNARKFKHRIKYFIRINKHLAKMKKNLNRIHRTMRLASVNSFISPNPKLAELPKRKLSSQKRKSLITKRKPAKPTPSPKYVKRKVKRQKGKKPKVSLLKAASISPES